MNNMPPQAGPSKMETVSQQKLKVAINGFGRIGRNFLRCWNGRENSLLDVVAINDSGGVKQVRAAAGQGTRGVRVCNSSRMPEWATIPARPTFYSHDYLAPNGPVKPPSACRPTLF